MSSPETLTVDLFLAQREELPDGGRWSELESGRLVTLQPPTIEHGTTVLNLSKALAEFVHREKTGYACFDLGLVVGRNPDTLRFPSISFFAGGPAFAQVDNIVTESRPALVIEIPSTNDRRRDLAARITGWLDWGIKQVWVLDPVEKQVQTFESGRGPRTYAAHQTLLGSAALAGFSLSVGELFKEPAWYR